MKNKAYFVLILLCFATVLFAQKSVPINNPETWKTSDMSSYVGQTVCFTTPFFVCNNYTNFSKSSLTISPRRLFSPTNQVLPGGSEYTALKAANSNGSVTLTGISEYHRMGERLVDLVVEVTSANTWKLVSCNFVGNTRNDLLANVPNVDMKGEHSLLVCAMNLEYYIVESFDPQYGPANEAAHQKQRTKIKKALAKINADLYGFVEIQQGQGALAEIAKDLSELTGRPYAYINDGGSVSGTYTKAGYVYCTDVVSPKGSLYANPSDKYRKKMQVFEEKSSGEAGYLDHALCNSTLLPQITGIQPYHINSDEHDNYTYDGSNSDETMFRSSDHDPILVGLKLAPGYTALDNCHVTVQDGKPVLFGAEGGFFQLYNINGQVVTQGIISSSQEVLPITLPRGFYIFCVRVGDAIQPIKIVVH